MHVWAVANQKGGVGKTTTAVTLGGWLARRGHKTLLIDLDPHGSLTSYFGFDPESHVKSSYMLFQNAAANQPLEPMNAIEKSRFKNLYILSASTAMATLDKQLGTAEGMGLVISRALGEIRGQFDYVIMDCPPMLGVLMVNALASCEHLIIPVQTEFLALKGLERMVRTLQMIQRSKKLDLAYTIVPTLYDKRTRASNESLLSLKKTYPDVLWSSVIPIDTQLREASLEGVPLPLSRPGARGALNYRALLDYLLDSDSKHITAMNG